MAQFVSPIKRNSSRVITPCCVDVSEYKRLENSKRSEYLCDSAMWDTGASVTLISERVASELGLVVTGTTIISGYDGKKRKANTYRIDLKFTDDLHVCFIEAVETPSPFFDLLIGMDVISQGNLHVDSKVTPPIVSFEI